MLRHGPEAEKKQFVKEYTTALKSSADLTINQVRDLVLSN